MAAPLLGNISGEVTIQELLSNNLLVPGWLGATLKGEKGSAIRFVDLAQLTINHDGVEFLLTREVKRTGARVRRQWRIYSGTSEEVPPPRFFDRHGPAGVIVVERIIGHTHPRPIPFELQWIQPPEKDIINLKRLMARWLEVYGPRTEPFARIIWGLNPGETTIYGIEAVPPPWLRR